MKLNGLPVRLCRRMNVAPSRCNVSPTIMGRLTVAGFLNKPQDGR